MGPLMRAPTRRGDWQVIHPPYCELVLIHASETPVDVVLTRGRAIVRLNHDEKREFDLPVGLIIQFQGIVEVHNKLESDDGRPEDERETEIAYKTIW